LAVQHREELGGGLAEPVAQGPRPGEQVTTLWRAVPARGDQRTAEFDAEVEFQLVALAVFCQRLGERKRPPEVPCRLNVGRAMAGASAGLAPVPNSAVGEPRFREVMCQQLGLRTRGLGEAPLERGGDPGV